MMNEMDLMKAIGDIKEEYIEEADPLKEQSEPKSTSKILSFSKYVKTLSFVAAGFVLLLSFGLFMRMNEHGKSDYAATSDTATNSVTTTEEVDSSYDDFEEGEGVSYESAVSTDYKDDNAYVVPERIQCDTLEDAMEVAGFSLALDADLSDYQYEDISAVAGEAIVFTLMDPEKTFRCLVRKVDINSEQAWSDNLPELLENCLIADKECVFRGADGNITYAGWNTETYQYHVTLEEGSLERADWERIVSGIN